MFFQIHLWTSDKWEPRSEHGGQILMSAVRNSPWEPLRSHNAIGLYWTNVKYHHAVVLGTKNLWAVRKPAVTLRINRETFSLSVKKNTTRKMLEWIKCHQSISSSENCSRKNIMRAKFSIWSIPVVSSPWVTARLKSSGYWDFQNLLVFCTFELYGIFSRLRETCVFAHCLWCQLELFGNLN